MVNKCVAPSCRSGYVKNEKKQIAKFRFPLKNTELNKFWILFVNCQNWKPTKHSVLCELHVDEKYIIQGEKCNLKWSLIPIPTNHAKELLQLSQSMLPTQQTSRKPLKQGSSVIPGELDCFQKSDTLKTLDDLNETTTPGGFQFKKSGDHALFYNLVFDEETQFLNFLQSIKVDSHLHVQLQYNGIPVPLPQWFVQGQQAQMVMSVCLKTFLHILVISPLKTIMSYLKK